MSTEKAACRRRADGRGAAAVSADSPEAGGAQEGISPRTSGGSAAFLMISILDPGLLDCERINFSDFKSSSLW